MDLSAASSLPVSSRLLASIREVRSPAATVSAMLTAWFSGRVMLRVSSQASAAPSTISSAPSMSSMLRPER
jgi:hypothetical protein